MNGRRSEQWTPLDPADHQMALLEVADAFEAHDAQALAQLTAVERADQLRARQALYHYVDALWEAPKLRAARDGVEGGDVHGPAFTCVAGLRDLTAGLVAEVERAQVDAGDDLDGDAAGDLGYLRFDRFSEP